jgi:hypothetical protein
LNDARDAGPAGKRLLPFILCLAPRLMAAAADDGMVDVHTLPQLEGAVEDTRPHRICNLKYRSPPSWR